MQRYDDKERTWIHLLNYQYDDTSDRVLPLDTLELTLRGVTGSKPEILVPEGSPVPEYEAVRDGDLTRITLRNAGLYTILSFGT